MDVHSMVDGSTTSFDSYLISNKISSKTPSELAFKILFLGTYVFSSWSQWYHKIVVLKCIFNRIVVRHRLTVTWSQMKFQQNFFWIILPSLVFENLYFQLISAAVSQNWALCLNVFSIGSGVSLYESKFKSKFKLPDLTG